MPSLHPMRSCPRLPPEHLGGRHLLGLTWQPFPRLARQLLPEGARSSQRRRFMNVLHVHQQFGPLAPPVASGHSCGAELPEDGPVPTFCQGSRLKRRLHRGIVSSGLDLICNAIAMQAVVGRLSILKSRQVNRQSRRSFERLPTEPGDRRAWAPSAACFQDMTAL